MTIGCGPAESPAASGQAADTAPATAACSLTPYLTHQLVSQKISDFGKVDFDASGSSDSNAPITGYRFDFGDRGGANGPQPLVHHAYLTGEDRTASVQFMDATGVTSPLATDSVTLCPTDPIPVTLPPVNVSYTDLEKFTIRIKYERLDLSFTRQAPASDATCSFTGTGTLPVTVGLGPYIAGADITVQSVATATLDFLRGGASIPECQWTAYRGTATAKNCLVGGSGDTIVRWHTNGFSERWAGMHIDSPPMTYYARVPSASTFAQAVSAVEPLLHVQLSEHLGWMHWAYIIQEPPADFVVVTSAGVATGVPTPGGRPVDGIPGSVYLTDGAGFSAVALLAPPPDGFTVRLVGHEGSPFRLSVAKISGAAAVGATDFRQVGTLGAAGAASCGASTGSSWDAGPTGAGRWPGSRARSSETRCAGDRSTTRTRWGLPGRMAPRE